MLKPIRAESLPEVFISRFEELILSGRLSIGEKLPSERELSLQLGVSRPVVHDGLVDLAFKGLVSMKPRVGTVVNDYRREGSLALLTSLINYQQKQIDSDLLQSMLQVRMLFETETARLAAKNRTSENLEEFAELLSEEDRLHPRTQIRVSKIDFRFHHLVALASGNLVYPLFINSFRQVYTNFTRQFFSRPQVITTVFNFHKQLVDAISKQDEDQASKIMAELLTHGENFLKMTLWKKEGDDHE